jgi:type IV secretory pathway TrbD component
MSTSKSRSVGLADAAMLLGVLLVGLALWLLASWPGLLLWCGALLMAVAVAETRRG